jgi:hypothetical protein
MTAKPELSEEEHLGKGRISQAIQEPLSPLSRERKINFLAEEEVQLIRNASKNTDPDEDELVFLPKADIAMEQADQHINFNQWTLPSTSNRDQSLHYFELRSGAGIISTTTNSNILPENNAVEWNNRHVQSYSALFGKRFSPKLDFSTGFQISRWNQRFNYTTVRELERPQSNQLVAAILLIDGSVNEQYGTLRQEETVRVSYSTRQEIRAFELPLNLHVELLEKGRWRLVTLLTGIFSWRQEIQGFFYPVTAWSDTEPELIHRELSANGSFFQMALGLGFGYSINQNYSVYCYPQWRSGQFDLEIDDVIEFTQEGGAFAIQVGLRRNL